MPIGGGGSQEVVVDTLHASNAAVAATMPPSLPLLPLLQQCRRSGCHICIFHTRHYNCQSKSPQHLQCRSITAAISRPFSAPGKMLLHVLQQLWRGKFHNNEYEAEKGGIGPWVFVGYGAGSEIKPRRRIL